jgi:hypothetical protein
MEINPPIGDPVASDVYQSDVGAFQNFRFAGGIAGIDSFRYA